MYSLVVRMCFCFYVNYCIVISCIVILYYYESLSLCGSGAYSVYSWIQLVSVVTGLLILMDLDPVVYDPSCFLLGTDEYLVLIEHNYSSCNELVLILLLSMV